MKEGSTRWSWLLVWSKWGYQKKILSMVVACNTCSPFFPWKASYKLPENASLDVSKFSFGRNLFSFWSEKLIFLLWRSQGPSIIVLNAKSVYSLHVCEIFGPLFWLYEQTCLVASTLFCSLWLQNAVCLMPRPSTVWKKWLNGIFNTKRIVHVGIPFTAHV